MYQRIKAFKSSIRTNVLIEGEPIEGKIRRILKNGEPITDKAPIVYTERKDGVLPQYDPRQDKWEIAVEAKTKIANAYLEKRNSSLGERAKKNMDIEKKGETSSQKDGLEGSTS